MSRLLLSLCATAVCTTLSLLSIPQSVLAQDKDGFSMDELWVTEGFSMPESAVAISGHPWIYVSNVNGEAEPGFISRLGRDGKIDTLKWVDGIQVPTGIAVHEDHLYVVDQTQVHQIDLGTAKIVETFKSAEATSLNDIDITRDGTIFVSELMGGSIHRLTDEALVPWLKSDLIPAPNGVLIGENVVYVGNIGTRVSRDLTPDEYGTVVGINIESGESQAIEQSTRMGTWDGLAGFQDGFIASSPLNGQLWYFYDDKKSLLGVVEGGIADIGTDPDADLLYAPLLFDNKVVAYNLTKFTWSRVIKENTFNDQVVDQYFGDSDGQSIAKSDGTIEGEFAGQLLTGTWDWKDGHFCRESKLGELDLGQDCIVIELAEGKMRLTLNKGQGTSVIYNRK